MGHLILQGDNTTYPGFSLLDESSLAITFFGGGMGTVLELPFLILSGTTTVSVASSGAGGLNQINQLEENDNVLTTVTIHGSERFVLGAFGQPNSGDGVVTEIGATTAATIHSSLTLIDASAATGDVSIFAGATNTPGAGNYQSGGGPNSGVIITYSGLTIRGGSGIDLIENDAKKGIVTDGNGNGDAVILGGAGAKATLGTGAGDVVEVGVSGLGTNETAGSALGDSVKFGSAATALLSIRTGAEAGSTAGTTSIGLTKVLNAADGMQINFHAVTPLSTITDETAAVASATSLTQAENDAVALAPAGVAYFSFQGNEYFIATNNVEGAVSSNDAIVKLVGITDIHHATNSGGLVTLHV
jgi:hypothetical protein